MDILTRRYKKPVVRDYSGIKVAALVADLSACGYYRVINPLKYLEKHGAQVSYYRKCNLIDLLQYDLIIAQRQYDIDVYNNAIKKCIDFGKTVIYEVDDNLHAVLPQSPVYGVYHSGTKQLNTVDKIVSGCHGLTTSTIELATDYSKYNRNVEVLPNAIDFELRDWETIPADKDTDTLYVGWSGGSTHIPDLAELDAVIPFLAKKYPHVKFVLYTAIQLAELKIKDWNLPEDRVLVVPPRPFSEYPGGLPYIDIGLAPLVNTRFNAAKSCLKYMEYSAFKIPSVCAVSAPYCRAIKDGYDGFLSGGNNTKSWVNNISALIEDETLRKTMGARAYDNIKENYDMENTVHMYPQAWGRIQDNVRNNSLPPVIPQLYGSVSRNDRCPCGSGSKYKSCKCYPAWGI